jgi:hypothetical protein
MFGYGALFTMLIFYFFAACIAMGTLRELCWRVVGAAVVGGRAGG